MKVKEPDLVRALDNPGGAIRLYLLYGPDESNSRALAARLERAMGPDAERIDLDGATLKDDPARLADEVASFSLFGGKRHIRVIGGDECTAAVVALLESDMRGNPAVLISGALKPASTLLKAALDHPAVLGCANFVPTTAGIGTLAVGIGRARGLRLSPDVAARLAANCLDDRAVLEREIEKLALYLDAAPDRPREADGGALDAIGADLGEADPAALVNAVLGGDLPGTVRELAEIDTANAWVPALRALQKRLILLARLRGDVDRGKSPSGAVAAMGKAIFYKDEPFVTAQLARWRSDKLATASARLFATEGALMSSGTAGSVLAAQELVAIARVADRLR